MGKEIISNPEKKTQYCNIVSFYNELFFKIHKQKKTEDKSFEVELNEFLRNKGVMSNSDPDEKRKKRRFEKEFCDNHRKNNIALIIGYIHTDFFVCQADLINTRVNEAIFIESS